jgi:hypothetical protein
MSQNTAETATSGKKNTKPVFSVPPRRRNHYWGGYCARGPARLRSPRLLEYEPLRHSQCHSYTRLKRGIIPAW